MVARLFEEIAALYTDVSSLENADPEELVAVLEPLALKKRVPLLLRAAQYLMEYRIAPTIRKALFLASLY
jgi:hypothetical protein